MKHLKVSLLFFLLKSKAAHIIIGQHAYDAGINVSLHMFHSAVSLSRHKFIAPSLSLGIRHS